MLYILNSSLGSTLPLQSDTYDEGIYSLVVVGITILKQYITFCYIRIQHNIMDLISSVYFFTVITILSFIMDLI